MPVQVCSVDVPERVCNATGRSSWRQAVLQTVHQHTAPCSGRPSHEGQCALSDFGAGTFIYSFFFSCLNVDVSLPNRLGRIISALLQKWSPVLSG